MKCQKCGNEYPSEYYFSVPNICNDCFAKMSLEEQEKLKNEYFMQSYMTVGPMRVGFGRRLGAFLTDWIIIFGILIIVFNSIGFFDAVAEFMKESQELLNKPEALEELNQEFYMENRSAFYMSNVLPMLYFVLEILIGASLGKLLWGIQIGSREGKFAEFSQLLLRFALKSSPAIIAILWLITDVEAINILSSIAGLMFIIGCFFAISEKRQALHDIIAKTAVFRKKDLEEAEELAKGLGVSL